MAERAFTLDADRAFIEIEAILRDLPDDFLHEAADDAMLAAVVAPIRRAEVPNAYFRDRTGSLRSSIDFDVVKKTIRGFQRRFVDLIVGYTGRGSASDSFSSDARPKYALAVHQGRKTGSGRTVPKPFLTQALIDSAPGMMRLYAASVRNQGFSRAVKAAERRAQREANR